MDSNELIGENDSDGDGPSILKSLLSEAEDMPVMMDEAIVIRAHLQAIEWATKARPLLVMPHTGRLSDFITLKKSIQ
eukprot:gene8620-17783_t